MKIRKEININNVKNLILEIIDDLNYSLTDRMELYRFINKLSDSENFEVTVNRQLSALKLKNDKEFINSSIDSRKDIFLKCGFLLKPVQETNWELFLNNESFLDQLDKNLARKIALDINVAFLIKAVRLSRT